MKAPVKLQRRKVSLRENWLSLVINMQEQSATGNFRVSKKKLSTKRGPLRQRARAVKIGRPTRETLCACRGGHKPQLVKPLTLCKFTVLLLHHPHTNAHQFTTSLKAQFEMKTDLSLVVLDKNKTTNKLLVMIDAVAVNTYRALSEDSPITSSTTISSKYIEQPYILSSYVF